MLKERTSTGPSDGDWNECQTHVFWGEIAPCSHVLQIYENDDVILSSLEGFVVTGFKNDESVIILATEERISSLNKRLLTLGYDIHMLREKNIYMPINAHHALDKFMVNKWPDEALFMNTVTELLLLARGADNRKVRAYGEMVAILWAQGNNGATVNLEQLWNKFCENENFCLFCAYPKSGFTQNVNDSIQHICSQHSALIAGGNTNSTNIFFKRL
jgi:hypothetical protein